MCLPVLKSVLDEDQHLRGRLTLTCGIGRGLTKGEIYAWLGSLSLCLSPSFSFLRSFCPSLAVILARARIPSARTLAEKRGSLVVIGWGGADCSTCQSIVTPCLSFLSPPLSCALPLFILYRNSHKESDPERTINQKIVEEEIKENEKDMKKDDCVHVARDGIPIYLRLKP